MNEAAETQEAPVEEPVVEEINPKQGQQKPITMIITFDPVSGGVQVTGPLENKVVMYAMFALGKETWLKHHEALTAQVAAKTIVPAFQVPRGLRG